MGSCDAGKPEHIALWFTSCCYAVVHKGLLVLLITYCAVFSAEAQLVFNGEFETPNVDSLLHVYAVQPPNPHPNTALSSDAIDNWIVTEGVVILFDASLFGPRTGQFVHLAADGSPGSIEQNVSSLIVGNTYQVSYWASSSTFGRRGPASLLSTIGSSTDIANFDPPSPTSWYDTPVIRSFAFDATESTMTLQFSSSGTGALVAIDRVDISPVPEPGFTGLSMPAALALFSRGRRNRQRD